MTLYDINKELENAFESLVDPETGEILDDACVLDALTLERSEKIENIALMIKNLRADAEAINAEAKKLKARAKACENRSEWLKNYLVENLQGEEFKSPRVAISWRRSESVKVNDLWKLPEQYIRIADPEPDKKALKKALKDGEAIEGAELVQSMNLQIK